MLEVEPALYPAMPSTPVPTDRSPRHLQLQRHLQLHRQLQRFKSRRWLLAPLLTAGSLVLTGGCQGHLPNPPQRESPDTPFNTRTMLLRGHSSNGFYSNVRQVNTGLNSFSFVETWFLAGRTVHTAGHGTYEPSSHTNIYTYTKPKGVVVVSTIHGDGNISSIDTVLNSTLPLFRPGDRITYEPRH